jgi:hypothetical protein
MSKNSKSGKVKSIPKKVQTQKENFLSRRIHRSFQMTSKHDKREKLQLPGNIKFSRKVFGLLWANRKIFLLLALFYGVMSFLLVGIASQGTYDLFKEGLNSTGSDLLSGVWGELGKAGLLFVTAINGSLSEGMSDVQQIYAWLLMILIWLNCVWLLRNILANRQMRLRDALYNSGSPLLPTFLVALLIVVQLIPVALAAAGYTAASSTGLLAGGVEAMLFWFVAALLVILSVYWITGTIFALVIVTLPGMYPMKAIRAAGDIVSGRRLAVIYRLVWMGVSVLVAWAVVTIPFILLDNWLKGIWPVISGLPTVPILILVLSTLTVVWVSSFVYLLYREVVDNDTEVS